MSVKKIICCLGLLLMLVGCSDDADDNYSSDHAVNRERCLKSIEDGSAYEIDDVQTASAPWDVGDVVAKWPDGEGGHFYRKFLGTTKAGYYLVQDSLTEPFALMSRSAVKQATFIVGERNDMPSACGIYIRVGGIREKGVFLDGVRNEEWISNFSDGSIRYKATYKNGVRNKANDGVYIHYWSHNQQLSSLAYVINDRTLISFSFYPSGRLRFISMIQGPKSSTFWELNENGRMIQRGFWDNGKKVDVWSKWDLQGQLIDEKNYK